MSRSHVEKATTGPDSEQLHRIEAVTDAELSRLEPDDLLEALLDRVEEVLEIDTAAVLLLDPSGNELVATAARGLEEEVRLGVRIPAGRGFAGRVAATQEPVILDRVDQTTVLNPILVAKGIRSLLGVPLIASGETLGVLHVGTLEERLFTADDAALLQVVADRAALAISTRLSDRDRVAAGALQRSLLPTQFPDLPGLDIAARYIPGEGGLVGGDWFDVFPAPDGRVVVVIGDVVGHGLRSAVVMGRLRAAVRAYSLDGHDPATVLTRLDRLVCHFEPAEMTTVLYAVLAADQGDMVVSTAGHPAPVIAEPGGTPRLVELPADPPVGASAVAPRRNTEVGVSPGATLYFFTDGVVERRGVDILDGIARLCTVASAGSPYLGCARIAAALLEHDDPEDDFALLGVHLTG